MKPIRSCTARHPLRGRDAVRAARGPPTPAAIAASWTRCIATPTRTWSPTCRPTPRSGRTRRRSCSRTRRSRIPRCTRTSSSRSRPISAKCLDKKVVFYQVQSNAAEIEAMRSGRLHVGGFSTGPTAFAVNLAGAIPFAVKGNREGVPGLQPDRDREGELALPEARRISRARRSRTRRRRRIPAIWRRWRCSRALGLTPDKDYKIIFSGKHDQSVMGVNSGDYDAAAVASDVFHRMAERGQVKEADFRIIYRSQKFPTSSFAYAHDLAPAARRQDALVLLRVSASRRKCRRPSTAPIASSRSTIRRRGSSCGRWPRARAEDSTRRRTTRKRKREADEPRPRPRPRRVDRVIG